MKLFRILAVFIIIGLMLLATIPIQGISSNPTTLMINSVYVFENNFELNDMAFAIDYTVKYSSTPSEVISDTFNVRLMSGTTQIRSIAPVPYFNNGYAKGLVWMYFSAADVITNSLLWNSSLTMRLDGNPTASWTSTVPSAPLYSGFNWINSSTTIAGNSVLITNYILAEAQAIQQDWNTTGYALYVYTATNGAKLTTVGESYFGNVIQGLEVLCPSALQTGSQAKQLYNPSPTPNKYENSISSDIQGTEYIIGTATFTQGSKTVTGDNTTWTSAMNGGLIKNANEYAYFIIQSVDAGTQTITLTTNYVPVSSSHASYSILYNAELGATTGAVSPLNLITSANALRIPKTIFGVLISAAIIVFVAMHGCGAANSYRPLILIVLPLLYLFNRIGFIPIGFTIGLAILAVICLWYVFFYSASSQ